MKVALTLSIVLFFGVSQYLIAQVIPEKGDPPPPENIPAYYKSTLEEISEQVKSVKKGTVAHIATSAGGRPVYAVYYGEKDDFQSQANYNSAVAARNPAFFAKKSTATKPVVFLLGPVHGQEVEGMAGLLNLLQIAETGKDHRGRDFTDLQELMSKFRLIIVPLANPDGRARNPYDSYVGLPVEVMTKYGQGTKQDGTLWRWPHAKSLHPMRGNVGILGAYFNDDGINMMHDDFFDPMAKETKAIMDLAKEEVPDITVSLHSCECMPFVIQNAHVPRFMKDRIADFAQQLNESFIRENLPHRKGDYSLARGQDDPDTPKAAFNLVSALHHASGTMSFTFESPHGTLDDGATHEEILDIQLTLYRSILEYALENRLVWD
ncbi:M14 family zinc carboxypeptidase [Pleomorphovibrio marinus]|uniref:M14 family zinc carboxypeptidase n=1 Tax=Pleomorphovibrio marinus TaxID=2164132 RepID=UPI000E0AC16B|nr:M14 family zinc carboxypeptidase [Pleomorphovibrio marinus]